MTDQEFSTVIDEMHKDLAAKIRDANERQLIDGAGEYTPPKNLRKLYEIVSEGDVESLSKAVEKRLEDGWKLCGGLAIEVIHHEEGYHLETKYHQAMTVKAEVVA